jgi:hypothetical protein
MSKKGNAPQAKQGKGGNINKYNIDLLGNKLIDSVTCSDVPDTIPGCYGTYSGVIFGCNTCIFEVPCFRQSPKWDD